jgi:putative phage-type endonuclease
MIDATRFIARSSDYADWLLARKTGITATQVAGAATPAGFDSAVEKALADEQVEDNDYMRFGRDNEGWLALVLKNDYGIMPNEWLIAHETERFMMATPDGLSLDHTVASEVKTTGTDWGSYSKVPIKYRRQVQWQLHCTGASMSYFAYLLRETTPSGVFVPAWFEPKVFIVERDEKMINDLCDVAHRLRDALIER